VTSLRGQSEELESIDEDVAALRLFDVSDNVIAVGAAVTNSQLAWHPGAPKALEPTWCAPPTIHGFDALLVLTGSRASANP
jgi:hypothetical protein